MWPQVQSFYDNTTGTVSHVVYDERGGHAAVIDPVLDYDPRSGRTASTGAERIVAFTREQGLQIDWILETHVHADHLSAAQYVKNMVGGKIAIGEHITQVQSVFKTLFHLDGEFVPNGKQFDHLFSDGEKFHIGKLTADVLLVPGHTPADVAYHIGNTVFVGDTLFMPDIGTARCDFPGGDARQLYRSIRRLLALPADTRLFLCHDYPPVTRAATCETTVARQRQDNIHVRDGIDENAFVAMRQERDAGLAMPVLILPSIQVNIRAGALPAAESNGTRYLKIPLDAL
jgi:glyoxylase-like metal-dependent hydrolase (beta-lactamase superfamily II)